MGVFSGSGRSEPDFGEHHFPLRRSEQKIPALFEVIFVGVDDIRLDKEAGDLTEGNQMLPQQGDDVLIDERIL